MNLLKSMTMQYMLALALGAALVAAGALPPSNPEALTVRLTSLPAPRTANVFLKTPITPAEAETLSQWHALVLGVQAQNVSPNELQAIKSANPNGIRLAYVLTAAVPQANLDILEGPAGIWHQLNDALTEENFLKDMNGAAIEIWPGMPLLNLNSKVNGAPLPDFLAEFWASRVLATGLWDGLFFDNAEARISHVAVNADLNNDGIAEWPAEIDADWQAGLKALFRKLNALVSNRVLLIGNGRGAQMYARYFNGLALESFPRADEGTWAASLNILKNVQKTLRPPVMNLILSDTNNTGFIDARFRRFTLGAALLTDAWYAFDFGTLDHSQLWWFPEYALALGQPRGEAKTLEGQRVRQWALQAYQREFQNGAVVVNPTMEAVLTKVNQAWYLVDAQDAVFINH